MTAAVVIAATVIAAALGAICLHRLRAEDRRLEQLLADDDEPTVDSGLDQLDAMLQKGHGDD